MADQQNTGEVQKGGNAANLTNAGKGRKKGIPNKITAAAKSVIEEAAEKLGGCNRLVAWAQEDAKNEHAFWSSIYPKLIPLNVTGSIKVDLTQALAAARARVGG